MLPYKSVVRRVGSSIVIVRPDEGQEEDGDARTAAAALGSTYPRGGGSAVRADEQRHRAHQLSDGAAGRRRPRHHGDRLVGAARPGAGAQGAASVPGRGAGRAGAPQAHRATRGGHVGLDGRTEAGDRVGPACGRRRQRGVDYAAAGRLPGRGDRPSSRDRSGAGASASAGGRLQTAHLEPQTQIDRAGGLGKKRLRVEAILAAAASPEPPPLDELMPDPLLRDELPEDLPWLVRLLPRADVYLQDEVEVALHPTLTRVWCLKGRRGQRLVEAPGDNAKEYGFGLVDWRDGWFDWQRAPGRRAAPFCAQLRRAVARSQARGRIALVLLDNLAST